MTTESAFTIRIAKDKQKQLDQLAKSMDRSRNWVVNQAIEQYLDLQAWQVEAIQKGIDAADQGDLIPHNQVMSRIEAKFQK
jgi:predicted transcriptional regulator